jgi:hypothetical protein
MPAESVRALFAIRAARRTETPPQGMHPRGGAISKRYLITMSHTATRKIVRDLDQGTAARNV